MNTEEIVSTKMQQIALNAKRMPQVSFSSLAYHLNVDWLVEAYKETRKDAALGVDNQSAEDYAKDLKANLESLIARVKSGAYKAPPVRRVYIDKENGREKRPLGIPTFEEKVLQKAVKWLIEPIYEQEFYDCSYGFRPNRSQHQAVKELREKLRAIRGAWIIDLDIRKYFDSINWINLSEILKQRVCDGVLIRLIGKWMNAGIMEEGKLHRSESGVPQGAVISPLLSNIYLHEILDKWFHEVVMPHLEASAFEIRFADDVLFCFENENDAKRVFKVLPKRLEKYGLVMHPEKTKLINFNRPERSDNKRDTFNFLGFTHYWAKSRKGYGVIYRCTMSKRLTRALKAISDWCRKHRHWKIEEQYKELTLKIRGHYAYYSINGNIRRINEFWNHTKRIWKKWLQRRSNLRELNWKQMNLILKQYILPLPRIVHPEV